MILYHYQSLIDLKIDKLIQMMTYVHHVKLFVKIFQVVQLIVGIKLYHIVIEEIVDDDDEINQWWAMMVVTEVKK